MELRKALIGIVGGIALSVGSLAGASSAQAASASAQAASVSVQAVSAHSTGASSSGWSYVDYYFWASNCIKAGNRGINNGLWSKYQCRNGGTFSNYELWVK